jgi:hypothetical protein
MSAPEQANIALNRHASPRFEMWVVCIHNTLLTERKVELSAAGSLPHKCSKTSGGRCHAGTVQIFSGFRFNPLSGV